MSTVFAQSPLVFEFLGISSPLPLSISACPICPLLVLTVIGLSLCGHFRDDVDFNGNRGG